MLLLSVTIGLVSLLRLISVFALHYICASASSFLLVQPWPSVCFLLICWLHICVCIVLQLIVQTCNSSIYGMLNLHNLCLVLWLIVTLQMPDCGIVILLQVFRTMLLLFVAASWQKFLSLVPFSRLLAVNQPHSFCQKGKWWHLPNKGKGGWSGHIVLLRFRLL